MKRISYGFSALLLFFLGNSLACADHSTTEFDRRIAPLLAERCMGCHSGADPKGSLDLSHKSTAMKGGENGVAIAPGDLNASLLWERVASDDMPPKKPLSPAEKALLKNWIEQGAEWGSEEIRPFRFSTDRRAGYDWWSLQPLNDVPLPDPTSVVDSAHWRRNPIDRFVLSKLTENGLAPNKAASPRTLVRRLYYDLLGLPPDADELKEFASDPSPDSYVALVDRLLQSPHYGERWGRHWLDVARFGESDGFERNNPRKTAWHYRDWVIQSLNDDMPYDEFARMQLAGDVLQRGKEGAAAVGFLVAGVHNTVVGGSKRMKLLARQDELEEVIAAVGQTFLGLTVNCARCHDHKFDPIPTTDYYRMIAAIDGVAHGERTVNGIDTSRQIEEIDKEVRGMQKQLRQMDGRARESLLAARKSDNIPKPGRPKAYATWEFESDAVDQAGSLDLKLNGNARVEAGALVVGGGKDFAASAAIDRDIAEKTLEAWVILEDLEQQGGGVITLQTMDGETFDSIVFAEQESKRWMAGSNGFVRTSSFHGPEESDANKQPVHVAITYAADGTITGYRNGVMYGKPYKKSGTQKYQAGKAQIIFGLRHASPDSKRMLKGRILRANLYDRALNPEAIAASAGVENQFVSEAAIADWFKGNDRKEREAIKSRMVTAKEERNRLEQLQKTRLYTVSARNPGVMRVHVRGGVEKYGDEVAPRGVAAIAGADFGLAKDASDAKRRQALADWVTSKSNPLFARVIVNRVWHYHFGQGIVETPNDLGFNGGRPSHQELLDWLARDFQENGFRLKRLHRQILTSAAYQQSSKMNTVAFAKDAENRLVWRFSPRRIEAEVLRDSILKVAGVLNTKRGGPGFEDVTSTSNNGTTYYDPVDPEGDAFNRRTVYRFAPRGGRNAVLDTFDCPDPSMAAPRRSVTTTPLQALSLLNNSFVLRMADHLASRVKKESNGGNVVELAWQFSLNRKPSKDEAILANELLEKHGLPTLCRALMNSNEFVVID